MNDIDKQSIIKRYNDRIEKYGYNLAGMASGTEDRRKLRFQILSEIGIKNGDSVLDLGCGFGDFSDYLSNQKLLVDYTGYDINPLIIGEATKRFPNDTFAVKDVIHEDFPEFDYIVSTSCFNLPLKTQDNYDFVLELLTTCYQHARKGVAIDFISSYVDFTHPDAFHYEPEKVFTIAKSLTKRVCLRHDYPLFEFAIYLYKDFQGWGKTV